MTATSEPAEVAPGTASFELERFERTDGRLELSGRWFGVRGMRFVRPTLALRTAAGSTRALADLEHKPWLPDDGEPWVAAFPCDGDIEVLGAELAVSSGIVVPLPAPGEDLADAGPIAALPDRARPRAKPHRERQQPKPKREPRASKPAQVTVDDELSELRAETERLRAEPVRLQDELERSEELRKDVEGELERLKLNADGAVARRDAAVDRFEDATADRDAALSASEQAAAELDRARAELRAGMAERDRAVADRDAARAERDRAVADRDRAATERARAVADRDRAASERDSAVADRDRARSQRASAISTRGIAKLPHSAPRVQLLSDDQARLVRRAAACAVLFVAGLALLIVLGVL